MKNSNTRFSTAGIGILLGLIAMIMALNACVKPKEADNSNPDPFHYIRPVEPSLNKTTFNCIVDSMAFGVGSKTDDNAYLYVRDVDNDSVYRIEIDSHTDGAAICKVDSSALAGVGTTFTYASSGRNFTFQSTDTVGLVLEVLQPNQRQLTIVTDSSWENTYALGAKKIIITITPQTRIFYTDENQSESVEFAKTDTASHNAAIRDINYTFLNDYGQPLSYYYRPIDWTNTYSGCYVYILRPVDWYKR